MPDIKIYGVVSLEAVAASGGNRGKMGAQLGHGFIGAYEDSLERFPEAVAAYRATGIVGKVVLSAPEETLHQLSRLYRDRCGVALIKDAGKTVFPRPMITVVGLGPIDVNAREEVLRGLRPWI